MVAGSAGDTRKPAADGKAIATKRSCCEARIMRIYVEKSVDATRVPKAMCRFASYSYSFIQFAPFYFHVFHVM